ncbi:MAG: nucleoside-diphosphate sugar epimerase/dehydratase, partial [Halofilum sp. (in: g-proteobacteria)]
YRRLSALSRPSKRAMLVALDCVVLPASLWLAFALRLGEPLPPAVREVWWLFIAVTAVSIPVFHGLGLYQAVVRHMGGHMAFALAKGVGVSTLLLAALALLGDARHLPRSILVLYPMIALLATGGYRFLIRSFFIGLSRAAAHKARVVIYGAGSAGLQAAAALAAGREYEPVAFIDDAPALQGSIVQGLRVHAGTDLPGVVARTGATEVLLAMPAAGRRRRREIVEDLEPLALHVKTLPSMGDLVSGHARVDETREVEIEDLLGRDAVAPNRELLESGIAGRVVLVTGAGGSIGSELCRQILMLRPTRLLLLDVSEFGLYKIEQELRALAVKEGLAVGVEAFLGSVEHQRRMARLMAYFSVDTVFHAAAYKHVPLVERNLLEGVRNNVFGTLHCARAAIEAGVTSFVCVSTDKAVRPTNVMGASKRLAELVLQRLARTQSGTRFTMVRFGNVLDSSGSVVPLFREQIRRGGPVTVTHPEVTRYFMTIPEASELVIQAGSLGQAGDVLVLDMGDPVRVLDLARRMIHLMGYSVRDEQRPDGEVEIEFIGLRHGEKLYEELLIGDNVSSTEHPMIMRAEEEHLSEATLWPLLERAEAAAKDFDCETMRAVLAEAVRGYEYDEALQDALWCQQQRDRDARESVMGQVVDIESVRSN